MNKNGLASILKTIGIIIAIVVALPFLFWGEAVGHLFGLGGEGALVAIIGIIVGFLTGLNFFIYSEIINLLQQNVNKQIKIISEINVLQNGIEKTVSDAVKGITEKAEKNAHISVVQDIESDLPRI